MANKSSSSHRTISNHKSRQDLETRRRRIRIKRIRSEERKVKEEEEEEAKTRPEIITRSFAKTSKKRNNTNDISQVRRESAEDDMKCGVQPNGINRDDDDENGNEMVRYVIKKQSEMKDISLDSFLLLSSNASFSCRASYLMCRIKTTTTPMKRRRKTTATTTPRRKSTTTTAPTSPRKTTTSASAEYRISLPTTSPACRIPSTSSMSSSSSRWPLRHYLGLLVCLPLIAMASSSSNIFFAVAQDFADGYRSDFQLGEFLHSSHIVYNFLR